MMTVIEARGLGKNFSAAPILRAVDLKLENGRGAIVMGGNGAGKSTLVNLLAGLAAPSSGHALLFGEDSRRLPIEKRRRLGLMTHQSFLYPNLTARENLEFYSSIYDLKQPRLEAARWLQRVGLASAANERVRALSRGMEQRLSLARAMIASPDALLMDEPLAGLDSAGVSMAAILIAEAMRRGCAVLMTAHGAGGLEDFELERLELSNGRLFPIRPEARGGRLRSLFGG